ncbi:hypothetical protein [Mammaliicoccus sciuri]|uniref:hypothetical protein n=1 Tax=Mammaliicoccus sciuri TaxID=1296 RepID=UPI000D1E0454|nr:hypothetical protein [Mammaliicoccus sciuri]PTJ54235.1 hypothetical protein BU012_01160 [Mammaliicoccus sciuri]
MSNNGNKYTRFPMDSSNISIYKQSSQNSYNPLRDLAKASTVLSESMRKIRLEVTEPMRKVLDRFNENWHEMLKGIREIEVVIEAFLKYDIPPHHKFKITLFSFIIHSYREGKPKEVVEHAVMNAFYSYIYPNLLKEWRQNQAVKSRIELLTLSLEGFKDGYYGLVVPTLIAQIEGVLLEKISVKNFTTCQLREIIRSIFNGVGVVNTDKTLSKFYCDKIVGNKGPSSVQRHGILHGSLYNYHNEMDAIKAILIFDTIISRVNDVDSKSMKIIYSNTQNKGRKSKKK